MKYLFLYPINHIVDKIVEDIAETEHENYKKQKIYQVLNSLDKRDRTVIEYLFGFKTGKPFTQKEVANLLNISQSYVARLSDKLLLQMKEGLTDFEDEYTSKDDNIERMNNVFYGMFKGRDKNEIKQILSKIRGKEYVYLYYGLDGKVCLDYDEIAYKYNIGIDEVMQRFKML